MLTTEYLALKNLFAPSSRIHIILQTFSVIVLNHSRNSWFLNLSHYKMPVTVVQLLMKCINIYVLKCKFPQKWRICYQKWNHKWKFSTFYVCFNQEMNKLIPRNTVKTSETWQLYVRRPELKNMFKYIAASKEASILTYDTSDKHQCYPKNPLPWQQPSLLLRKENSYKTKVVFTQKNPTHRKTVWE